MDVLPESIRTNPDMARLLDKMSSDDEPYPVHSQSVVRAGVCYCVIRTGRAKLTSFSVVEMAGRLFPGA